MGRIAGAVDAIHRNLHAVARGLVDYGVVLRRPRLNFDFASFSFQVPICGFSAKLVEQRRVELLASALRTRRSAN